MANYGIVVDLNRCTGCMTCVIACKEENLTPPQIWWNKILEVENEPLNHITYVRHACMHCENPACMPACKYDAIYKTPEGIVLIDQKKCVGAGDCIDACPYGAISLIEDKAYFEGTTLPFEESPTPNRVHKVDQGSKCTMCYHLVKKGKDPRCVQSCPSRALTFGDLDDPRSPIHEKMKMAVPLLPEAGTKPKVAYIMPTHLKKSVEERVDENPFMIR